MNVTVTQLSKILGISTARIRQLLIAGRIKGAFKFGHMWSIPLVNGMPQITKGRRGPKLGFAKRRPDAVTRIHVNRNIVRDNKNNGSRLPVITVKQGKRNQYCHEVIIHGSCRLIYQPDKPLDCEAAVWIETYSKVELILKDYPPAAAA
jgi:hypothetical protein